MKRRRFLQIAVGALVAGRAAAGEWRGQAFGADTRILVRGSEAPAQVIAAIRHDIEMMEATFSLYRDSELSRLNRDKIGPGSPPMRHAIDLAMQVHAATGGAFDPGVQTQWQRLCEGTAPGTMPHPLTAVRLDRTLRLMPRQSLTFNGLAQGMATDRIAALPEVAALGEVLVDMGEQAALNGSFKLELDDPSAGRIGQITLAPGRAVATSSPGALLFPTGESHILGPKGQRPLWSTVSVEAHSAALADAAATAFVLMERPAMKTAAARLGVGPVRLVDFDGNLSLL